MEENTEKQYGQEVDPNFIKYLEIHPVFRSEMTYEQRLAWWKENDIESLTILFFPEKKLTIEHRSSMRHVHQYAEQGENVKSLTIEPFNPEQLKIFEEWARDKSMSVGTFTNDCFSKNLIRDYWVKVGVSPMPKEVLSEEMKLIDRVVNDAESYPDRTAAILFLHSYRRRKLGYFPVIEYDELYNSLFSNGRRDRTVDDLESPERIIPNLYKGWAYCEYQGFLQKQQDRLSRGEDISKPNDAIGDEVPQDVKKQARVKLQWNGPMDVLYDLFAQLQKLQSPDKDGLLIANTYASFAEFIAENVEGAPAAETIAERLRKMRNDKDGVNRPKRYRIDIETFKSK